MLRKLITRVLAWRVWRVTAWTATVLLVLAVGVRLTVRDGWKPASGFFYCSPWPVIWAGTALVAAYWLYTRRPVLGWTHAVFAVLALGEWLGGSWRTQAKPESRGDLRVVLWNVSRPDYGLPAMARWLRAQDADLIALAEGHSRFQGSSLNRWQQEFPEYTVVELRAEMTCLVRGKILEEVPHPGFTDLNYALLRTEIRGRPVTVLQVDVNASVFQPRERAMRELSELVNPHVQDHLLVLGDFNTPRESALLDPLRGDLRSAFETAGHGLAETWPVPFPMLSLDQVWSSVSLPAVFCRHGFSVRSDHRAVIADFRFRPAAGNTRQAPGQTPPRQEISAPEGDPR